MTPETLFRLSGLSLVIGGLLATTAWLLFALFDPAHQQTMHQQWLPLNALAIAGGVFMGLGLPGFYARQAARAGTLGFVGFVLLFVGIVIPYVAVQSIETLTAPNIPPQMMLWVRVGAPSAFLGIIITGVATWRTNVYPASAGMLLILSALVGILTVVESVPILWRHNLVSTVFTMTMAWLGVLLMKQ